MTSGSTRAPTQEPASVTLSLSGGEDAHLSTTDRRATSQEPFRTTWSKVGTDRLGVLTGTLYVMGLLEHYHHLRVGGGCTGAPTSSTATRRPWYFQCGSWPLHIPVSPSSPLFSCSPVSLFCVWCSVRDALWRTMFVTVAVTTFSSQGIVKQILRIHPRTIMEEME